MLQTGMERGRFSRTCRTGHKNHPVCMGKQLVELFGNILLKAKRFEGRDMLTLCQNTHYHTFTVVSWQNRDPHIQCFTRNRYLGTSVLWYPLFRNIQVGDNLDTVDHQSDNHFVKIKVLFQCSVNTQPYLPFTFTTLNMNIARLFLQCLKKERVYQLDNRRRLFTGEKILGIAYEFQQIRFNLNQILCGCGHLLKFRTGLNLKKFVLQPFKTVTVCCCYRVIQIKFGKMVQCICHTPFLYNSIFSAIN